ncbi:hypothetical protein A3Q56_04139, partial [Intoshia linei]
NNDKRALIDNVSETLNYIKTFTMTATERASKITNKQLKNSILMSVERLSMLATQLRVVSTVKATLLGVSEEQNNESLSIIYTVVNNISKGITSTMRDVSVADKVKA